MPQFEHFDSRGNQLDEKESSARDIAQASHIHIAPHSTQAFLYRPNRKKVQANGNSSPKATKGSGSPASPQPSNPDIWDDKLTEKLASDYSNQMKKEFIQRCIRKVRRFWKSLFSPFTRSRKKHPKKRPAPAQKSKGKRGRQDSDPQNRSQRNTSASRRGSHRKSRKNAPAPDGRSDNRNQSKQPARGNQKPSENRSGRRRKPQNNNQAGDGSAAQQTPNPTSNRQNKSTGGNRGEPGSNSNKSQGSRKSRRNRRKTPPGQAK